MVVDRDYTIGLILLGLALGLFIWAAGGFTFEVL